LIDKLKLDVLSAGAAQGVVTTLAAEAGVEIGGSFGAVGAIREKFLAGAPCDIIILTQAQIAALATQRLVLAGSCANLGAVFTGIAVRKGDSVPDVSDDASLRAALLAADEIYFPDAHKATAGIHFAKVLDTLGIISDVASRLRTYPNGATAMRELARASGRAIGCTQVTEILNTPGVVLVAQLPKAFELATVYSVAVNARSANPEAARRFAALLTTEPSSALRAKSGFTL
jgi:molybdate transport system substrate-binding protein